MSDFNNFVQELENIVSSSDSLKTLVDRGSVSMQALLKNEDLLQENYINGLLDGSSDCNIYKSENNNFIVQVFVWEGGSQTPVHDHDTWGLMGIYRNQLKITEFCLKPREQAGNFDLNQTQTYVATEGSVCYLIPPDEEIHHIVNPTSDLSISIHVYGKRIDEYNIYDRENDKIIHVTV